jgi:hypothetical protein
MKETSPEKPRFEIVPPRAAPAGLLKDVRELGPKPTAGLSHGPMANWGPRGPPDSMRGTRDGGSGISLHEE